MHELLRAVVASHPLFLADGDKSGLIDAAIITGLIGLIGVVLSILVDRNGGNRRHDDDPEPAPAPNQSDVELHTVLAANAAASEVRARRAERELSELRKSFDERMTAKRAEEKRLRAIIVGLHCNPDDGQPLGAP